MQNFPIVNIKCADKKRAGSGSDITSNSSIVSGFNAKGLSYLKPLKEILNGFISRPSGSFSGSYTGA